MHAHRIIPLHRCHPPHQRPTAVLHWLEQIQLVEFRRLVTSFAIFFRTALGDPTASAAAMTRHFRHFRQRLESLPDELRSGYALGGLASRLLLPWQLAVAAYGD